MLSWALMLPTLINGAIGYLVGTSIAVIGLYIAFALPILLRIRAGERFEHGAWSLGRHYSGSPRSRVAWIAVICVLFLLPVSPKGIPGAADFDWNVVNYAPLTVGAAVLLFGGWYLLSARYWFVGPIPDARLDEGLRWSHHAAGPDVAGQHLAGRHIATTGARPAARPVRRGLIVLAAGRSDGTRVRVRRVASHDPASDPAASCCCGTARPSGRRAASTPAAPTSRSPTAAARWPGRTPSWAGDCCAGGPPRSS